MCVCPQPCEPCGARIVVAYHYLLSCLSESAVGVKDGQAVPGRMRWCNKSQHASAPSPTHDSPSARPIPARPVLVKDRQAATGRTLGCYKSQHASAPLANPRQPFRAPHPRTSPRTLSAPCPPTPGLPTRCLQTSGPVLSSPAQMSGHHLQASSMLHHTVTCATPPYTPDPIAVHLHSGTPTAALVPYTHYGPCAL